MRLILYAVLLYIGYRLIKSWLLKSSGGHQEEQPRFSGKESRWSSFSGSREKDVTDRSRVLDD
ncbi:MAG: hypothetical protein RH862_07210 [Leptospiraceae bacterium]